MQKTKIEYLDRTWNPIAMRCTPISDGCRNCWHLAMAKRCAGNRACGEYQHIYAGTQPPKLKQWELEQPLHLQKPARIGVQFMGDLFHKSIPFEFQTAIFEVMATGDHWFYILTKRAQRMKEFFQTCEDWDPTEWPGIWLGVSVEDQKTADERIPILLQIPAAHRWVSVEPMLERVDLSQCWSDYLAGWKTEAEHGRHDERGNCIDCPIPVQVQTEKLDWVVCGGESGPGARPLHPDWVRSLRDQCQAAGVPLFIKTFPVNDKLTNKMDEWPEDVRIREYPNAI